MEESESSAYDEARASAFAERMGGVINNAALALMASIGHRTGLYDVMAMLPPSTSADIAHAAHLDERYVREWLASQVTGAIVEFELQSETYWLPPERAASLTRKAESNNAALFGLYITVKGGVEDEVVLAFRRGGGVPCAQCPCLHQHRPDAL